MNIRNVTAIVTATLIGIGLPASTVHAIAGPRDAVVQATRTDPDTDSRMVAYNDLNLASKSDQRTLRDRISHTAHMVCRKLTSFNKDQIICARSAVLSTDDQVAAAIDRETLKLAGKAFGPEIAITMVIGVQ